MENLQKVETLREKANVSYGEAKAALEQTNWDLLDAVLLLEQQGKIKGPSQQTYSTENGAQSQVNQETQRQEQFYQQYYEQNAKNKKSGFKDSMERLWAQCGRILKAGNENMMDVVKQGRVILSMPLTIFVILVVCAFWFVIPVMLGGMFFGIRYSFRGPAKTHENVNKVMDFAGDKAEQMKSEFMGQTNSDQNNVNEDDSSVK